MIINFTLENWMSFRDSVSFSMVASRERQHGKRVPRVAKYPVRILPIAAMYGGNASGKTNFFQALNFAKKLVTKPKELNGSLSVKPFSLDTTAVKKPTRFTFELLIDELIYEFSFAVTSEAVIEEKLVKIISTGEKTLYHRCEDKPILDKSLDSYDTLKVFFDATSDNQLFLNNSVFQEQPHFRPIYDWFNDTLVMIAPDTIFNDGKQSASDANSSYEPMCEMLSDLDTGIARLGYEEIPFEHVKLPKAIKQELEKIVKEGTTARVLEQQSNERFLFTRVKDKLVAKKLVTYHPMADGAEVQFEMRDESDGSQRLIDLLPGFQDMSASNSNRVYVIDELDRSLHTQLTRHLLETYLASCSQKSRSQLLFTTHDVLLMDQDLLRRDEMWVAERDARGASTLIAFSEYEDVRYDKDIRKSYLQGRLGGIPRILISPACTSRNTDAKSAGDD